MSAEASSNHIRVVLDTNVLLSLYVFADSRFAALRGQIESGRWQAITNAECRAEFARVLNYPMFNLATNAQEITLAQYQSTALEIVVPLASTTPVLLPRCTDPDDQKFLELARDSSAALLITSDKALLKLSRHLVKSGMFRVFTPDAAMARIAGV